MNSWSNEQMEIFEAALRGDNVGVIAAPGSGKTTTAGGIAQLLHERGIKFIFLTFMNSMKDALKQKSYDLGLPDRVFTLHQAGVRACGGHMGGSLMKSKYDTLLREKMPYVVDAVRRRIQNEHGTRLMRACLARALQTDHNNRVSKYDVSLIAKQEGVHSSLVQYVTDALNEGLHTDYWDFPDQLWRPIALDLTYTPSAKDYLSGFASAEVVIVDEAQDLTGTAIELIARMFGDKQFIFVGDPRQAIMGFAGAMPNAMTTMAKRIASQRPTTWLTLSTSWRLPVSTVVQAIPEFKDIKVRPGAPLGSFTRKTTADMIRSARDGDFIIGEKWADIISLALDFVMAGKSARIGRSGDFTGGVRALLADMGDNYDYNRLDLAVESYIQRVYMVCAEDNYTKRETDMVIAPIQDSADLLLAAWAKITGVNSITELMAALDRISSGVGHEGPILGTTWTFKGLEAENVYILSKGNPAKAAMLLLPNIEDDIGMYQASACAYVALTRSKLNTVEVVSNEYQISEGQVARALIQG